MSNVVTGLDQYHTKTTLKSTNTCMPYVGLDADTPHFSKIQTCNTMSNPMSNLRKNRKAPFKFSGSSQNVSVPFRTGPEYFHNESALLDDITGNMVASRMSKSTPLPKLFPPNPHQPTSNTSVRQSVTPSTAPSDHDLMALMMTRVCGLEQRVAQQAADIVTKDKKIHILDDKVKILQRVRDESNPGRCQELEQKCLRLQKQVHGMEAFLQDYGMVWVGEDDDGDDYTDLESLSDDETSPSGTWRPGASVPGGEFHVDYDIMIKHIQELNVLAGDGVAKVQHTTDGARLKMPDPIQLTLYSNGIVLFSGPFRPFTDPSTQACIRDISDGFFPSELQHRYPDGIPFSVTDKREVYFRDRLSEGFTGAGQVLGGETRPSRLIPSNLPKASGTQTGDQHKEESVLPGPKLSVEQFLKNIPSSVIKNGNVIDVRTGLADVIKVLLVDGLSIISDVRRLNPTGTSGMSEDRITLLETAAVQEMKDRMALDENSRPPSSRNVSTLRIKSDDGQTFIVKMKFNETIGHLRTYLDHKMPPGRHYQIMSTFPSRTYTDEDATLEQCGLIPNAALHLRVQK